jgi:hypothetical protein
VKQCFLGWSGYDRIRLHGFRFDLLPTVQEKRSF